MKIVIEVRDDLPTLEKRQAMTQIINVLLTTSQTITQATRAEGDEITLQDRQGREVAVVTFSKSEEKPRNLKPKPPFPKR